MRITLGVVSLALLASLPAQSIHLVDATGATGRFRTISAAIAAANNDDVIHVKKGTYVESLSIAGKAVSILGIAPNLGDVTIQAPASTVACSIRNHPSGRVSRFARFTVVGAVNRTGIESRTTQGDLVFDQIVADAPCDFSGHTGSIAMSSCVISSRNQTLTTINVRDVFCHQCTFRTSAVNTYLVVMPNVTIQSGNAHLSRCYMNGSSGGRYLILTYPGGAALTAVSATVRVSGLTTDIIQGGNGITTGSRTSVGGSGINLYSSNLILSSVKVTGGLGAWGSTVLRAAAISKDRASTVTSAIPPMPVLSTRIQFPVTKTVARGSRTAIDIQATPGAQSITWIAVGFSPSTSTWGPFVIDLSRPSIPLYFVHDSAGKASYTLDLRPLPATFVGVEYAMQTIAIDRSLRVSLSGPRIGVIGF